MDTSDVISRRPLAALATVLLAASLALAGCGAGGGGETASDSAARADQQAGAPAAAPAKGGTTSGTTSGTGDKAPSVGRQYIVRTATLTVEARNVADALARTRTLVSGAGGYVGDESTSLDDAGREHSRITLRIPPAEYDQVLDDLAGLGKLLERKVTAQDVTGQVVDVQSRITSQRASVARVRELMDRAVKLSDVVTLEGELSTRQADLEALEAQQASLGERTGMATVTLVLTEPEVSAAPKKDDGVWASVVDALGAGWHAFYVTFRAVLIALAAVLPFAAPAFAVWLGYRAYRRRVPARERTHLTPPAPVTVPAPIGAPPAPPAGDE